MASQQEGQQGGSHEDQVQGSNDKHSLSLHGKPPRSPQSEGLKSPHMDSKGAGTGAPPVKSILIKTKSFDIRGKRLHASNDQQQGLTGNQKQPIRAVEPATKTDGMDDSSALTVGESLRSPQNKTVPTQRQRATSIDRTHTGSRYSAAAHGLTIDSQSTHTPGQSLGNLENKTVPMQRQRAASTDRTNTGSRHSAAAHGLTIDSQSTHTPGQSLGNRDNKMVSTRSRRAASTDRTNTGSRHSAAAHGLTIDSQSTHTPGQSLGNRENKTVPTRSRWAASMERSNTSSRTSTDAHGRTRVNSSTHTPRESLGSQQNQMTPTQGWEDGSNDRTNAGPRLNVGAHGQTRDDTSSHTPGESLGIPENKTVPTQSRRNGSMEISDDSSRPSTGALGQTRDKKRFVNQAKKDLEQSGVMRSTSLERKPLTAKHELVGKDVGHKEHMSGVSMNRRNTDNEEKATISDKGTSSTSKVLGGKSEKEKHKDMMITKELDADRDLLRLIDKFPFEVNADVNIITDISNGKLLIRGKDQNSVIEARSKVFKQIENFEQEHINIPEYQIPFFKKRDIVKLVDEAIFKKKIQCFWGIDRYRLFVVAWKRESIERFAENLSKNFRSTFVRCDKGDNNLIGLCKSNDWNNKENELKLKYGDIFQISMLCDDAGYTSVGIIAPKGIFEKIWGDLEMLSSSYKRSVKPVKQPTVESADEPHVKDDGRNFATRSERGNLLTNQALRDITDMPDNKIVQKKQQTEKLPDLEFTHPQQSPGQTREASKKNVRKADVSSELQRDMANLTENEVDRESGSHDHTEKPSGPEFTIPQQPPVQVGEVSKSKVRKRDVDTQQLKAQYNEHKVHKETASSKTDSDHSGVTDTDRFYKAGSKTNMGTDDLKAQRNKKDTGHDDSTYFTADRGHSDVAGTDSFNKGDPRKPPLMSTEEPNDSHLATGEEFPDMGQNDVNTTDSALSGEQRWIPEKQPVSDIHKENMPGTQTLTSQTSTRDPEIDKKDAESSSERPLKVQQELSEKHRVEQKRPVHAKDCDTSEQGLSKGHHQKDNTNTDCETDDKIISDKDGCDGEKSESGDKTTKKPKDHINKGPDSPDVTTNITTDGNQTGNHRGKPDKDNENGFNDKISLDKDGGDKTTKKPKEGTDLGDHTINITTERIQKGKPDREFDAKDDNEDSIDNEKKDSGEPTRENQKSQDINPNYTKATHPDLKSSHEDDRTPKNDNTDGDVYCQDQRDNNLSEHKHSTGNPDTVDILTAVSSPLIGDRTESNLPYLGISPNEKVVHVKLQRMTGLKEGNMNDPNAVKSMYKQEGKMDLTRREGKTNQKGFLVEELKEKPVGTISVYCEKWKFDYLLKNGKGISMLENNFKVVLEMKNNDTLYIYGSNSSNIRDVEVELKKMILPLVKLTPGIDMLYVWRFAFTSPVVSRKMDKALKEFDAVGELNEDCVIVQIDCHKPVQSTEALSQAISTACKDICKASFRFNLKAREDIEQEIDFLKEKKTTLLRPVNPFKSKEADIYMVNISESEGIVVLVTLDRFFKMCQDDVSGIIKKYEALSSDIPKVSSYVSAEGYTQHKEFDAESHNPITHVRNKDGECMPKPIREDKENYQLLGQISVNMNCEKWKYDCLRKIDGGLVEIEQKYDVRVSLKDDTTLCIEGKSKDTLTQMTGVIRKLMKGLVRKIRPVDVVDHEKLEADQDYKQRIEAFEKKYSIAMELGHFLDYEENVETSFDDLNVILSKTTEQSPQLVQIELQFSDQGFGFIIGGRMFMEKELDGVIRCAMKQSINHTMALLLDNYGDQGPKATQIVSAFVSCLKDTKKERGSVYTLYVCTHTAGQWFDLKDMLSRNTLSTFTPPNTYRTGQSIGIEIVSGELAKQKVDVLVNSTNENFTLDQGAVSLSLLKAAGKGMQDEINNKNKKNLKASQLLETKGYRLKSKHVLHSFLYSWNFHSQEKQEVCKKSLQKFVYNSLRRTEELGCKSMAFPALGAGILKYPLETVATEMIATIHKYNRDNPGSCIENVLIVIYTADQHIFQVFKRIQQELNEKQNEKALPYKVLEKCVVLAGRKENVAGANDHLMSELLSADPPRMDISGRFKTNYDATRNTQGNNKRFRVENEDNLPLTPANEAGADLGNSRNKATVSKDDTANIPGQEQRYGFKTGLTPDKGAIPKTKGIKGRPADLSNPYGSASNDTAPRDIDSSLVSDDVWQVKSPGVIHTPKAKPRKQKIQMVDSESIEILDKFLEQITVSLNKTVMRKYDQPECDALKKNLKEYNNVELDLDSLTLQGKAKDLVSAEKKLSKFINRTQTSDSTMSQTDDDDDADAADDDDDDDYEVDPDLEETYFERSLSRVDNKTIQGRQIKNVRKEVFVFLKVFYKRDWMMKLQGCQVEFDNGEITIQSAEDVRLAEVSDFIKSGIDKLDKFYFCDIASNKTVEEIMKACKHVKGDSNTFDNVYVYEDDGVVRLSGSLFEQVDEFSKIVRTKLAGVQPRSRANRKLDMVSDEVVSPSLWFETSLVGPSHDKVLRGFDPEMQKGCRSFYTDEGLKVYVYKADILHIHVDGIVNAANSELKHGGGIAKIIAKAAGPSFKKESEDYIARHKRLYVGESCVTTAGGLSYKCVIHTVGPRMSDYGKDQADDVNADLYKAIYSSLEEARKAQLKSVGIPSVSSGVFGVPQRWCSMQYCLAVKNFGKRNSNCCLKEIHFIDIDDDMLNIIGLTCDVVFNGSEKAKKELRKLKPATNKNTKARFRQLLSKNKNDRRQVSVGSFPRIRHSFRSKIKLELRPRFVVAVCKGNIVDFEKGVIVCNQDTKLKCLSGVAKAIIEEDPMYRGNFHQRYRERFYDIGEVLVFPCKTLRCSHIYNVIVHEEWRQPDMSSVSLCYTQVLQKADTNRVEKIALPLITSGRRKMPVKESAQALYSALISFANSKEFQHKFPSVYIYSNNNKDVEVLVKVLKDLLLAKKTKSETQNNKDDVSRRFHTPPSSPINPRRLERNNSYESMLSDPSDNDTSYNLERKLYPPVDITEEVSVKRSDRMETDFGGGSSSPESADESNADRPTNQDEKPPESLKCAICMDSFDNPKTLSKCGHTFCTDCVDDYFKVKPVCPCCSTVYGVLTGTQPKDGKMYDDTRSYIHLPGYEKHGCIRISYSFSDGIQEDEHPDPGKRYHGTRRTAYLPDNQQGRKVLKLLQLAFNRRLVFTIGRSVTTGMENVVTWNDIHHKTNINGGPSNFGYPDNEYLARVTAELAAKGVTEDDLE